MRKKRVAAGFAVAVSIILLITRMGLLTLGTHSEVPKASEACEDSVSWKEVWKNRERYIGKEIAVTGAVAGTAFISGIEGKPTFINLGNPHPRTPRFEIIIWEEYRPSFIDSLPSPPEVLYHRRTICVAGTVQVHEGIPQMEIRDSVQIILLIRK